MTLDNQFEERVRSAFAALVDATPLGFDFDELSESGPPRSVRPMASSSWVGQGWVYAVAAAVVVLVLVGGSAFLLRGSGGSSPVAENSAALSSLTWSRIPHDESVFGGGGTQSMSFVTAGGPGLVSVGGDGLHQSGSAAVWTSFDGLTWSRVPHDEAVFGGPGEQWMGTVTTGGPGLVAVGWDLALSTDADAAVWTSTDGVTWSRVPHDEEIFGGQSYQAMWGVTAGGPGLVAVGEDRSRDLDDGDVAVWTSVDGITWSRVPHDEAALGAGQVTSVTSANSGLVVAVGNEGSDGGDDAAVWISVDGITWSRVAHDEKVFGGAEMQGVTVGGPGLVAVGTSGPSYDRHAAVWTSIDGITWSRVRHDEDVFGGPGQQWIESVIATGAGLVAVGGDDANAAVWTSIDGITWFRVPDDNAVFSGARIFGVTVGGPGLVTVGASGSNDKLDAAVWVLVSDD